MRIPTRLALLCPLMLVLIGAAAGQPERGEGADDGVEPRLAAQLWIDPLGDGRFRVGVELIPDPGWHTYGEEPGDTGLPPVIRWLPEGDPQAQFGELSFPPAETFVDAEVDLVSHGYSGPVLLATSAHTTRPVVPLVVEVEALVCANLCLPASFRLRGVLEDGVTNAAAGSRFDAQALGPLPRSEGHGALALGAVGLGAWLSALALGWLGGMILNLMPCVLPVLAIKLASLASLAHATPRERGLHAGAYAAGISLSMLALAGAVLGLRAAGHAVGWGFQLQEPVFVVAVCCLVVAFALNLFGVFEIDVDTGALGRLGADASGAARSFSDGLLAVVLATPCSAPFLGTAVGFAFANPAPVIVSIFLAIGLGLATPFLVAAAIPAWTRFVPRSGAWMHDLRAVLGFSLLLTAVALLWVLGRTAGVNAITSALLLLLGISAASVTLGALQRRSRRVPATAVALVLGGITAVGLGAGPWSPAGPPAESSAVLAGAMDFDAKALERQLRNGRPAFVYFTADWCVTCKVNERTALADARVGAALERLDFAIFRADWTRRDESIRQVLAGLGKAGVPVYALYAPGSPDRPRLLPELLTVGSLVAALEEIAAAS